MDQRGRAKRMEGGEDFYQRLERYPELQARMEALLEVVENASGDVVKADEAEQRVVEELRQLGQEALQAWAERKHQRLEQAYDRRRDVSRKEKKSCGGGVGLDESK